MNTAANITDAEWLVMRVLWEREFATASEITSVLRRERDVSAQTVKTLLRRLVDKQLVDYEINPDDSRIFNYHASITRDEAIKRKNEAFISQVYQNNVGEFLAHFVENGGLSEDELISLQRKVSKLLRKKS